MINNTLSKVSNARPWKPGPAAYSDYVSPVSIDLGRNVPAAFDGKTLELKQSTQTRSTTNPKMSFEIYRAGITDTNDVDVAKALNVVAYVRYSDENGKFKGTYKQIALSPDALRQGDYGNNARYSLNLRELNPLPALGKNVKMQVFFSVNGAQPKELRPGNGFVVDYSHPIDALDGFEFGRRSSIVR